MRVGARGNASPSERTNQQVVVICALLDRLLPGGSSHGGLINPVADRPVHDRRYAIDVRKITSEMAWRRHHSFEQGLEAPVRLTSANLELYVRLGGV